MPATSKIAMTRMNPIQSGDKTHHHYQVMTCVSLRTMNTIVRRPVNPMPPPDELLDDDMSVPVQVGDKGQQPPDE